MAPAAAQQAHGKTIDQSMYQVTTSVAASFVDLDGERWRSVRRIDRRQKKVRQDGLHAGRRIRVTDETRKVTRTGRRFPKCLNIRRMD